MCLFITESALIQATGFIENEVGGHVLGEEGAAKGAPVNGENILRESGITLDGLFGSVGAGLALVTSEGRIIKCNEAFLKACAYDPNEPAGLNIRDLCQDPALARELMETLDGEEPVRDFVTPLARKDGTVFFGRLFIAPASLKEQKVFLVTLLDASKENEALEALKAAGEELAHNQEQLNQAQKMNALGVLMAGIAHELNNPINQIMFNTPLLQRIWQDLEPEITALSHDDPGRMYGGLTAGFLRENIPQLLVNMDMAAKRIAGIVSDLKQFSKHSPGAEKQPVQLNTAVTNAVDLARTSIRKAGINVLLELEDELPLMEGNIRKLEQVSLNLLINALQAVETGPGEVRIRTRTAEDGRLELSVSDTGKGVSEEIADRIFDAFVTDKQEQGGTGLGLSVTRSLVKAHGGDIRFETGKDGGATFHVLLPALAPQHQEER